MRNEANSEFLLDVAEKLLSRRRRDGRNAIKKEEAALRVDKLAQTFGGVKE